jgi:hypothetical protein
MPNFAAANRVQLAYVPESAFGTIPTTGNPYALRTTGESLAFKVHVQYAEYDRLLAGLMRSSWSAYGTNGVGTTFSASVTAGTLGTVASVITAGAAPTGSSAFASLQPGQWFRVNMPGDPNDGKLVRVSTSVATTTTTVTLDVNTPLTASTSVAGSSISTSRLTNGVTLQSFTIEKQMLDVGQYHTFRGMNVSKFSTTFASKSLTEGTFTFLGKDMLPAGATQLTGTVAVSNTYDIQNGVRGLGQLWEGGAPLTSTSIKSVSMDIDSGLRAQDAAGTLGLVGVGIGTFKVTGKLTVYFATGALYAKFLADTYTSFVIATQDTAGNGYIITAPKVMLTSGKVLAGGQDTDIMAEFDYTAYADKTNAVAALRQTLFIDRVGAAVAP